MEKTAGPRSLTADFLTERQTAYNELWQMLEAVHLSVRTEEFREEEFHDLVRAVNVHLIHSGLHIDSGEKKRVNEYPSGEHIFRS